MKSTNAVLYAIIFSQQNALFSGGLGKAKVELVHLEPNSHLKPYHVGQAFSSISPCYMETPKREIKCLCLMTVLKVKSDSGWAAGTFIKPKKDW